LGLLVSKGGYPITYELFEGKKFEGHTILPVLDSFKKKYDLSEIVVVADSGLLSDKNIQAITEKNYQFILGARIKNEVEGVKNQILKMGLKDKECSEILKPNGYRLIISYSNSRAKKDAFNRQRGLSKLEKAVASGKLTKKQINNKGYNKYLKLDGSVNVTIDREKYNVDAQWDGLKGYVTNASLSREMVIEQYMNLWEIEKTFRISKTDLRIRPIYHHVRRRIEAHICIAFAACKLYKELERQLKVKKACISPEKAIDILKTVYEITIVSPYSNQKHSRLILKNEEQKELLTMFNLI
jgi:transposase